MWLLRTDESYKLEHFHEPPIADVLMPLGGQENHPGYAILSHTWGEEEITFSEIHDIKAAKSMKRFKKVELTCRQAYADGLEHAWIDTCCIDKSSSAELAEAINSMFYWYQKSAVCYVYLSDFTLSGRKIASWGPYIADSAEVHEDTAAMDNPIIEKHKIQKELIAPTYVAFFDESWTFFGERAGLANVFATFMIVPRALLQRGGSLRFALDPFNIAARFSWAYNRHSTRVEDAAYSLLGLFDVNMPLLYGEGPKALVRLQEAIMRTDCDDSILLWRGSLTHTGPLVHVLRLTGARMWRHLTRV
ncbi:hypothetical protein EJ03DRAFT_345196 [Teratosphaeria nubilosa]|uniref:Heterokaryon incompatibility domain-containing protein n=1 Tax=Teratosphaeria nubilosa TaxID=161662 RepID=A0A6G1L0A7_9PEZI|nr:hypothetical protein EJ03DRAFT_345196 [Teratosphaeria nubilosa]